MIVSIFPCSSVGKESACSLGDTGSIPGLGRSPGEGNGNPLQYPCLENLIDREAWWAAVHWDAKSRARLSDLTLTLLFKRFSCFWPLDGAQGQQPLPRFPCLAVKSPPSTAMPGIPALSQQDSCLPHTRGPELEELTNIHGVPGIWRPRPTLGLYSELFPINLLTFFQTK